MGVLEGGECWVQASQSSLSDVHLGSNPVGLAVHDCGHVVLVGGNDLGDGEGGDQRFASTTAPQSRPWSCFACWQ